MAWPPLAGAIAAADTALRKRQELEQAAIDWNADRRIKARLWSGGQLAGVLTDLGASIRRTLGHRGTLTTEAVAITALANDFLRASVARDRWRRGHAVSVLAALLGFAIIAAVVNVSLQKDADEQAHLATARQLIAQAQTTQASDPRAGLRLALAAAAIYPGSS